MKKIEFKSKDGLLISADYYSKNQDEASGHKGFILLCHRSHCNRAEYRETAPKFNDLGYSCLAIDQRSGMKVFGASNETKDRAKAQKMPTGYLDAKPDIEAGIDHAFKLNGNRPIILLGSSYSAALSLLIASESSEKLKSILVFSAGEHLKGVKLSEKLENIEIPIFCASAKKEIQETAEVLKNVKSKYINHFKPTEEGFHGSKIMWESVKGYEKVWDGIRKFLIE